MLNYPPGSIIECATCRAVIVVYDPLRYDWATGEFHAPHLRIVK